MNKKENIRDQYLKLGYIKSDILFYIMIKNLIICSLFYWT